MRSPITRAILAVVGAAALAAVPASPASADEQAAYCVYVPNLSTGIGPRPMSTQQALCVPWPV